MVRAARAARPRRRGLAAHPRRPRPSLRPHGADARPPALSARTRSLQPHAEDARVQGRGRGAQHELVPPAARGHVRQPRRGPGSGRADQGGAAQHPRADAADLPPRRGMRRRLQLRGEEHARLQLPDRRVARRRRDPHPLRGARVRAARGRRLDRPLHRAHRRARGAQDRHERASTRHGDGGRPGALGGHARKHVPAAPQPRRPSRAVVAARRGLHRQRRPAHVRHPLRRDRDGRLPRAAPNRSRLRPRDHERGAHPRRARRGWSQGPRPLHRGRRLPRVRVLDAADGGRAERADEGRGGARPPRAHASRQGQREHQRRRLGAARRLLAVRRRPSAADDGA